MLETAGERLGDAGAAQARRQATEFIDIERQVLAALLGHPTDPFGNLTEPVVVLANDLMPSDTADFTPRTVRAFATESGGPTSHTAILAGALEIPAVVGIGRFLTDVSGGDMVIVDGDKGLLILDPDEETLARYEAKRAELLARAGPVRAPPRQAGRHRRRGPRSGCSATSSSRRRRPTASTAGPRASACTAPSSCT